MGKWGLLSIMGRKKHRSPEEQGFDTSVTSGSSVFSSAQLVFDEEADCKSTGTPDSIETPPSEVGERRLVEQGVVAVSLGAGPLQGLKAKGPGRVLVMPGSSKHHLSEWHSLLIHDMHPNSSAKDMRCLEAVNLLQGGDIKGCEKMLDDVLRIQSDHLLASICKVVLTASLGDLHHATQLAQDLIANHPKEPAACQAYGHFLFAFLGDPNKALEFFERALHQNPKHLSALCNYAAALQKIGRLKESEALYSRALNVNHRCYYAWCNLGVLASMHQDYRVAEHRYVTALGYNPYHEASLYNYGVLLREKGEHFKAEDTFRRCLAVNPQHQGALVHLGLAMYRQHKDTVRARELFQRAIDNDPHDYNAMCNMGLLLSTSDNDDVQEFKKALDCFERCLRIKPGDPIAERGLAALKERMGSLDEVSDSNENPRKLSSPAAQQFSSSETDSMETDKAVRSYKFPTRPNAAFKGGTI